MRTYARATARCRSQCSRMHGLPRISLHIAAIAQGFGKTAQTTSLFWMPITNKWKMLARFLRTQECPRTCSLKSLCNTNRKNDLFGRFWKNLSGFAPTPGHNSEKWMKAQQKLGFGSGFWNKKIHPAKAICVRGRHANTPKFSMPRGGKWCQSIHLPRREERGVGSSNRRGA